MSQITIIGAGQSGLQLGLGLLQNGYDVTIISDRTPEEIYNGRIASSQCMFDTPLSYEFTVSSTECNQTTCRWLMSRTRRR